ncbi:hypothetical protein CHS0354_004746 [Potamilus streckersoni]|uniref:Uncharacterized protein n=1 Tax=Potamilus streckersoni TaxID=2493646 RepID=A0AAE0TCY8_9BIVA|nr:hypothetical protein CHS0354_004746 [Potamilus streckersoni]
MVKLNIPVIIFGCVIGGLFVLGALIAFIIRCIQSKNRRGVVVNPNNVAHTFIERIKSINAPLHITLNLSVSHSSDDEGMEEDVQGTNQYYPQQLYGAYPAAGPSFVPQNQGHPPPYSEKQ